MKKIIKYALILTITLCFSITLNENTQAMAKSKVVKVKVTTKEKKNKFYGVVKGLIRMEKLFGNIRHLKKTQEKYHVYCARQKAIRYIS